MPSTNANQDQQHAPERGLDLGVGGVQPRRDDKDQGERAHQPRVRRRGRPGKVHPDGHRQADGREEKLRLVGKRDTEEDAHQSADQRGRDALRSLDQ